MLKGKEKNGENEQEQSQSQSREEEGGDWRSVKDTKMVALQPHGKAEPQLTLSPFNYPDPHFTSQVKTESL